MSACLRAARPARERCVIAAANLLAARQNLTALSTSELLAGVRRRFDVPMSAARNLAISRIHARELAHVDAFYTGHSTLRWIHRDPLGDRMDLPLSIHYPACCDQQLVVQSFGIHKASGQTTALLTESTLVPGDTVQSSVFYLRAVVISEVPHAS